jgi:hypothetical protein
MKKLLKWVVIGVVVVLAFTYAMYALEYKGNYNLSVTVPIHSDSGDVTASTIAVDSDDTSVLQFWDKFSLGGDAGTGFYTVYCQLNVSGDTTTHSTSFDIAADQSLAVKFTFDNIEPGQGSVRVYIVEQATQTKTFDDSWGVNVG